MTTSRYVVITPARNEEAHIEKTILSMISQTVKPLEWIIVNDGSSDGTGSLIDQYTAEYSWIRTVHRKDRGFRKPGGGVMEAFYDGYHLLESTEWDYIVKLDGDLSFEADYFERCFEYFRNNPLLGIGGGVGYIIVGSGLEWEPHPLFHVRGITKIYKKECWDAIGELIRAPGWDTLDEVKANMLGWETRSIPDLHLIHHRPTGSADGTWRGWVKNGVANYVAGYHPLFILAKCIKRCFQKPAYVTGASGLFYGFVSGYIKKVPQVEDRDLIHYLRKQQLRRLSFRKSIWK